MVQMSQISIAYGAFNDVAGRKDALSSSQTEQTGDTTSGGTDTTTGTSSTPPTLKSWAEGTMGQIATGQPTPSGGWFPKGVSFDAWLRVRAEGWFMNPNWAGALNSYSETSAVKDLTMIEAYRAYLQYLQYRDGEETNLLLSQDTVLLQKIAGNNGN
jgi:hypothetical protein